MVSPTTASSPEGAITHNRTTPMRAARERTGEVGIGHRLSSNAPRPEVPQSPT
jgi:hypothetical protein